MMQFSEKELAVILEKKIDKILFQAAGKVVMEVNINKLINEKIESDPNLKKQLVTSVLQSDD